MEICPRGINIPAIFGLYNVYKASEQASKKFIFAYKYKALDESTRVDKCIDCKLCTKKLPEQNFSQGERRNSRRTRRLRKRQKTLQIRLCKIRRNLPDRRDNKTRRQITDFEHTKVHRLRSMQKYVLARYNRNFLGKGTKNYLKKKKLYVVGNNRNTTDIGRNRPAFRREKNSRNRTSGTGETGDIPGTEEACETAELLPFRKPSTRKKPETVEIKTSVLNVIGYECTEKQRE